MVGLLLAVLGVACGDGHGQAASSDLAGTWLTAPGFDDVTMRLKDDGTFTWNNRTLGGISSGTWTSDAKTLTFSYVKDQPFCAGGTLTWEYQVHGDTLTSETVANTCGSANHGNRKFERQN